MGANVNQTAQAAVNRTVDGEERTSTVSNWTALMAASQLGYNESIEELLNNGQILMLPILMIGMLYYLLFKMITYPQQNY